jgi:hypothetical protein
MINPSAPTQEPSSAHSQGIATRQIFEMPNASQGNPSITEVEHDGVVVIVGANGSGKSRLGAWLESPQNITTPNTPGHMHAKRAHRISAHRVLNMPAKANRRAPEDARREFSFGSDSPGRPTRVHGDPIVGQMNDFHLLVDRLFAEESAAAFQYMAQGRETKGNPGSPKETVLEKVKAIWDSIFIERELVLGDHTINVRLKGARDVYPASQMSDGERVGFYLIGEVLLADLHLVVIDEPELHVHESIQSALWDAIETARPECAFAYITHDLTFAASRVKAPKIVLYDYDPTRIEERWTWNLVPSDTGLPEDVVLRIAGSRRPTVFTEGIRGSLDEEVFEAIYPHCYIVPSENADAVVHSVGAFTAHNALHRYEVFGLIDRDDRDHPEIQWLADNRVHAIPVAGVENLLLITEALEAVADNLRLTGNDRMNLLDEAKKRAISLLRECRDKTIALRAQHAIERRLSKIPWEGTDKQDLLNAVWKAQADADPEARFNEAVAAIDHALNAASTDEAYERTLIVFRNKGLIAVVAQVFGITKDVYLRILLAMLRDHDCSFTVALRSRLPSLS